MSLAALCLAIAGCGGSPATEERGAAVVAAGENFPCTPTRVWDGDGPIWCAEGPRIRMSGIAAREMDGSCRPGHPCPAASAAQAKAALVHLLGGERGRTADGHAIVGGTILTCRSTGGAGRSRTAAACALPDGRDLSCAMIGTRTVERWARYDQEGRLSGCR